MKFEGTSSSFKLQFSCACVSSWCFLSEGAFPAVRSQSGLVRSSGVCAAVHWDCMNPVIWELGSNWDQLLWESEVIFPKIPGEEGSCCVSHAVLRQLQTPREGEWQLCGGVPF